jgi:peptidoglycan-N-acetylglucosamine deacetylase
MKNIYLLHLLIIGNLLAQVKGTDTLAFYHGSRNVQKIALTFDACPSSVRGGYDTSLVKVLVDSTVPATFFMSGKWIKRHRREVKYLAKIKNFELANHSYTHPHCTAMREDSVINELNKTDSLLRSVAGHSARLFRPPYAETNGRLEKIADSLGYTTVMFDLVSGDPDTTLTKERLLKRITSRARNGSIIIMHMNGRGWHTAEVLPEIIHTLRKDKFTFVKVGDMLNKKSPHIKSGGGTK